MTGHLEPTLVLRFLRLSWMVGDSRRTQEWVWGHCEVDSPHTSCSSKHTCHKVQRQKSTSTVPQHTSTEKILLLSACKFYGGNLNNKITLKALFIYWNKLNVFLWKKKIYQDMMLHKKYIICFWYPSICVALHIAC